MRSWYLYYLSLFDNVLLQKDITDKWTWQLVKE